MHTTMCRLTFPVELAVPPMPHLPCPRLNQIVVVGHGDEVEIHDFARIAVLRLIECNGHDFEICFGNVCGNCLETFHNCFDNCLSTSYVCFLETF